MSLHLLPSADYEEWRMAAIRRSAGTTDAVRVVVEAERNAELETNDEMEEGTKEAR